MMEELAKMSTAQKTLLLDTQEQKQVMISKRTLEWHLSAAETVRLLNLPVRQIQRMLAASLDVWRKYFNIALTIR